MTQGYLEPVKVFSQRAPIPEEDYRRVRRDISYSAATVATLRARALATIERRIEKYCATNNVELYEPIYLDGIEVYKNRICLRQFVVCKIKLD